MSSERTYTQKKKNKKSKDARKFKKGDMSFTYYLQYDFNKAKWDKIQKIKCPIKKTRSENLFKEQAYTALKVDQERFARLLYREQISLDTYNYHINYDGEWFNPAQKNLLQRLHDIVVDAPKCLYKFEEQLLKAFTEASKKGKSYIIVTQNFRCRGKVLRGKERSFNINSFPLTIHFKGELPKLNTKEEREYKNE